MNLITIFRTAFVLLVAGLPRSLRAYDFVHHYHTGNGLLSNVTYEGIFDRDHYLWICTDRGLSRFNGTTFTHFTVEEGLPDNDIIHVTEDANGTIWAMPFQREAAFLERGKTLFTNINTLIHPDTVACDRSYTVFPLRDSSVALLSADNTIRLIRNRRWTGSYKVPQGVILYNAMLFLNQYEQLVVYGFQKIAVLQRSGKSQVIPHQWTVDRMIPDFPFFWLQVRDSSLVCIDTRQGATGRVAARLRPPVKVHRFGFWGDSLLTSSLQGPLLLLDRNNRGSKRFDNDNNLAFASSDNDGKVKVMFTSGEGIYAWVHAASPQYRQLDRMPYYFFKTGNGPEVLDAANRVLYPSPARTRLHDVLNKDLSPRFAEETGGALWFYGNYLRAWNRNGNRRLLDTMICIKDVCNGLGPIRYLATSGYAIELNTHTLAFQNRYTGRATSVANDPQGRLFIGTYSGLLVSHHDSTCEKIKGIPGIRITDLVYTDGTLWVATAGKGLFVVRNQKVVLALNKDQGLLRNAIDALETGGPGQLIIGYARGAQRLSYHINGDEVAVTGLLNLHTGLHEGIRILYRTGDTTYGIGHNGLFLFPLQQQEPLRHFNFRVDRVLIDGNPSELRDRYHLPAGTHHFALTFSAINYEQFPLSYRYRINQGPWNYTSEPEIRYPDLGPGSYQLEVQILSNYREPSATHTVYIDIRQPLYRRAWFIPVCAALAAIMTALLISSRYRRKYRKTRQTLQLERKLRELELAALKAQITPHFVFNCLNTLKSLIYREELDRADRYVDCFALLFRNTLDAASVSKHSLSREISYLRNYLELEFMNLNGRFSFSVTAAPGLDTAALFLPPLLLQPYAENAVKHGMKPLRDREGSIRIDFCIRGEDLICSVTDNGPGFNGTLKTEHHTGKGMEITGRRAQLYRIRTTIRNLTPSGTGVILCLPLSTCINEPAL